MSNVLITGCFDNSDKHIIDEYETHGYNIYHDGNDPRLGNGDNVVAKLHSNMLIEEIGHPFIKQDQISIFRKTNLEALDDEKTNHWRERAVNLMVDMDNRYANRNWLWKDTHLAFTLPAWHSAITKLDPDRQIKYVICYQHPSSSIRGMRRIRDKKGSWAFRMLKTDKAFYEIYEAYFGKLIDWLETGVDVNITGIPLDSDYAAGLLYQDDIYDRLRKYFND